MCTAHLAPLTGPTALLAVSLRLNYTQPHIPAQHVNTKQQRSEYVYTEPELFSVLVLQQFNRETQCTAV